MSTQMVYSTPIRTKSVHGSHDEEAPVGGHETGGKGESGPWVEL